MSEREIIRDPYGLLNVRLWLMDNGPPAMVFVCHADFQSLRKLVRPENVKADLEGEYIVVDLTIFRESEPRTLDLRSYSFDTLCDWEKQEMDLIKCWGEARAKRLGRDEGKET